MIRKSTINLMNSNKGKIEKLEFIMNEMSSAVNQFIEVLWNMENLDFKFIKFKVDSWLSTRMQQCLGNQALSIVKNQKKRKKKTKPIFKGNSFYLSSCIYDIKYDQNSFDLWVKLYCIGNKIRLRLPSKKHKHFNKFRNWKQLNSILLRRNKNKEYSIDIFFEKETPKTKENGKTIGVDIGYKKLLITSENKIIDIGLEVCYEKISRKKQGSKAFKRALKERDNLINQSLNNMDLTNVKEIVCEDLKNVKKKSKGKIKKSFNNKLQRWTYPKVLNKLSMMSDERGILLTRINPSYTSQKCSLCGVIRKSNRQGETYKCSCGLLIDADLNAAINISHMGVYSPHAQ